MLKLQYEKLFSVLIGKCTSLAQSSALGSSVFVFSECSKELDFLSKTQFCFATDKQSRIFVSTSVTDQSENW